MAIGDRGSYPKGKVRRKQILDAALTIIAVDGFDQTSLSKISKAVGITDVGVLHYFDSMDDLMMEVLRQRDANDMATMTSSLSDLADQIRQLAGNPDRSLEQMLAITARNAKTPGLVELYAYMSVKASNPKSPAHKYFKRRGRIERTMVGHAVETLIEKDHLDIGMDPEDMARIIQALLDGLQIQWLIDRNVDMSDLAGKAITLMRAGGMQHPEPDATTTNEHTSDEPEHT
ncbi:TetR/AcrR family transcriptional regulator [Bifidobacterium psychraerophilum]|uniref:TetR/AcrR family transcriptional regulator n=1 Tax=Bifidobacterium psychraerophilum TaxID=218140 RepID=UPI00310EC5F6